LNQDETGALDGRVRTFGDCGRGDALLRNCDDVARRAIGVKIVSADVAEAEVPRDLGATVRARGGVFTQKRKLGRKWVGDRLGVGVLFGSSL